MSRPRSVLRALAAKRGSKPPAAPPPDVPSEQADDDAGVCSVASVPSLYRPDGELVEFPMYVVSIRDLLTFDHLLLHEELQARGLLRKVEGHDMPVHFISQRWLSRTHPDPDGVKLRRFQALCRQILEEDPRQLFEPEDWEAFSTGSSSAKTHKQVCSQLRADSRCLEPADFQHDILEGFVWWDGVSVPQHQAGVAKEQQVAAIDSIPSYIERSAYFWVVVPEALHAETGRVVGYEDWQQRGWCRLEEWGNFLSIRTALPLIVTASPKVGVVEAMDFMNLRSGIGCLARHAACQGHFTCCAMHHQELLPNGCVAPLRCDRPYVGSVLVKMLQRKVGHYRSTGKDVLGKFLEGCSYSVLAGTGLAVRPGTAAELLRQCGAETVHSTLQHLTPLSWAATTGTPALVRELLQLKAQVDQTSAALTTAAQSGHSEVLELLLAEMDEAAVCLGSPTANITGLDRAAKVGHVAVCNRLLAVKASPSCVRKDNGQTPLHTAAEAGFPEVCRVLLAARAAVDNVDERGRSPLILAAQRLTLFGRCEGKADCARVLLEARANPDISDSSGRTAEDVAVDDEHGACLAVLQAHRRTSAESPQGYVAIGYMPERLRCDNCVWARLFSCSQPAD